jgi:hypothetical protein
MKSENNILGGIIMLIELKDDRIIIDEKPMSAGAQNFVVLVIISIMVMGAVALLIHFKG